MVDGEEQQAGPLRPPLPCQKTALLNQNQNHLSLTLLAETLPSGPVPCQLLRAGKWIRDPILPFTSRIIISKCCTEIWCATAAWQKQHC